MKGKNVGFVSTRFAGIDGVSLEASKWSEVLEQNGHQCFWFAGELDRSPEKSFLEPKAHFQHDQNQWINSQIFGKTGRNQTVTELIHALRSYLKMQLYNFINQFKIDLLIVENALTIPLNLSLGLALAETIAETEIPTIAHHHDFYWERNRFSVNAVSEYLRMAFPPNIPNIRHVVINSEALEQMALRTGISSIIVPNVLDFDHPPVVDEKKVLSFRNSIGLDPDDKIVLQPTRIIRRKGIEQAIELVKELKDPRYKLVVSHEAGDEGFEYAQWLQDYALEHGVDLRMLTTRISDPWNGNGTYQTEYTLWDIYPCADFITYPSVCEGFGNALIEAVYFKKPILVNRYATFIRDIEPKGFELIVMDGFLTKNIVHKTKKIIESPELKEKMVNTNYKVASRHYSYSVLKNQLNTILNDVSFQQEQHIYNNVSDSRHVIYLKRGPSPAYYDRSVHNVTMDMSE
ncbi:MAG: glycosyltransferase family 4 protein [Deltaproteobacteria bacterium]|jgi:glycosyltransferase involved in cell wall biosynthesis|nr:glycosyltransferase family 4 protein [Deltaproteobacteria bacterium]